LRIESDTSSGDGRATTPDHTIKMGSAGYVFERFVMLTYFAYIFWHALKNPKNYSFLTFWTLLVHILYFSIDKASPVAGAATRLLHGMSFVAAVAVLAAYSQMAVAGSLYWGSFYEWERQIGQAIGASIEPDWWMYLYLRKAYEHIWPVLALLIDARLNRAELQRCYRGCSRAFRTALALGGRDVGADLPVEGQRRGLLRPLRAAAVVRFGAPPRALGHRRHGARARRRLQQRPEGHHATRGRGGALAHRRPADHQGQGKLNRNPPALAPSSS